MSMPTAIAPVIVPGDTGNARFMQWAVPAYEEAQTRAKPVTFQVSSGTGARNETVIRLPFTVRPDGVVTDQWGRTVYRFAALPVGDAVMDARARIVGPSATEKATSPWEKRRGIAGLTGARWRSIAGASAFALVAYAGWKIGDATGHYFPWLIAGMGAGLVARDVVAEKMAVAEKERSAITVTAAAQKAQEVGRAVFASANAGRALPAGAGTQSVSVPQIPPSAPMAQVKPQIIVRTQ